MPNDVSYFKVPGDSNTYAFNDRDAESGLAAETARAEAAEQANADAIAAETNRATTAEQANASAISAEASRAAGVEGTLSNLTTTEQGSLVAAINEVDANTDANTASISSLNSNLVSIESTLTTADYFNNIAGNASLVDYNFRMVTFSATGLNNRRVSFSWTASTQSNFSNIPPAIANQTTFVGIRDVFYINSVNILVRVTECYPTAGRLHFCFYNSGTWTAWKTITPT